MSRKSRSTVNVRRTPKMARVVARIAEVAEVAEAEEAVVESQEEAVMTKLMSSNTRKTTTVMVKGSVTEDRVDLVAEMARVVPPVTT
jgi:hypothetical protein